MSDPDVAVVAAPARVRASWRRSQSYGVSLEHVEPTFSAALDTDSLFYDCGHRVLRDLYATIENEPVSLMLADPDGFVLDRHCNDTVIARSLDRVHLAPGFTYAERAAGTNGLGLSLADRAPTLVRAGEHYCADLRGYTCAAVPVLDPRDGELAGTVNLTTWSDRSSQLLLALAQAAAGATAALMLARAGGRTPDRPLRGEIFHVVVASGAEDVDACVSVPWRSAVDELVAALGDGRVVAVVGEQGAGKATLAALARRRLTGRARILLARAPAGEHVGAWLASWTPELKAEDTCVVVSRVDALPAWAADEMVTVLAGHRRTGAQLQPFVLAAREFGSIPSPLAVLVDTVVEAPPLRHRAEDVLPLARRIAGTERQRPVGFAPAAARALTAYHWPGNVAQLRDVVRRAAARTDVVDARHLPPEVFTSDRAPLSRLEVVERDEIVRCLTEPGVTVAQAAQKLGIGRATIYRKIAQYGITLTAR